MEKSGIGIGTLLFIVFLIFKLIGVITWSWWWVTSPLWLPLALLLLVVVFLAIRFSKEFAQGVKDDLKKM